VARARRVVAHHPEAHAAVRGEGGADERRLRRGTHIVLAHGVRQGVAIGRPGHAADAQRVRPGGGRARCREQTARAHPVGIDEPEAARALGQGDVTTMRRGGDGAPGRQSRHQGQRRSPRRDGIERRTTPGWRGSQHQQWPLDQRHGAHRGPLVIAAQRCREDECCDEGEARGYARPAATYRAEGDHRRTHDRGWL